MGRRLLGTDVREVARCRERRQRVVADALDERLRAEHRARLRSAGRTAPPRNRQCTNIQTGRVPGGRSLPGAPKRSHHIGSLERSTHVLMFRAKENPGDVTLLVAFAANVLEHVAGHVELVIDVACMEPTV